MVIRPKSSKPLPVLYLLHGYSGDHTNWVHYVPSLKEAADRYGILIVCPQGGFSGWYIDSPRDSVSKYETFIAKEVPLFIDSKYKTIASKKGRAITGLSMGGFGALFIASRHPQFFGAAGSMSGALLPTELSNRYEIKQRFQDSLHASSFSLMHTSKSWNRDTVSLIIDCGIEDPFLTQNRKIHSYLLALKVPHEYIERPGGHNWKYWSGAVQSHLLFFDNYFRQNNL